MPHKNTNKSLTKFTTNLLSFGPLETGQFLVRWRSAPLLHEFVYLSVSRGAGFVIPATSYKKNMAVAAPLKSKVFGLLLSDTFNHMLRRF